MAIAPNILKKKYENLSVEELQAKYEELKKHYCFNSKEEQINDTIKNYLHASSRVNNNSSKTVLEELLKEKTGEEYRIEPKLFKISVSDIINVITNSETDPFWTNVLNDSFQSFTEISEEEKMEFLIELVQDKKIFNEFTKELIQTRNIKDMYNKYQSIAHDYVLKNMIKG